MTIDEFIEFNKNVLFGYYVAMDRDGDWVLYLDSPFYSEITGCWSSCDNRYIVLRDIEIVKDWKKSLRVIE